MHDIERGTGRKLLLVHGLGGSWQSWNTILDRLSAERTVLAIDLPGHGATPAERDSGSFNGLVRSVERFIGENGLAGIDMVGSSVGARVVLELARRGGVGNVVALDPGGVLARLGTNLLQGHDRGLGAFAAGNPAGAANAQPQRRVAIIAARAIVFSPMGP